jgi:UDP:flavonoid glycosyltransferase YjiC (YdhE family)
MTQQRRRVLFLAEGITMTHFVRPAVLAESLDPQEWEVHFRTPKRYHRLLRLECASLDDLPTLDPSTFLDSLANGRVLYRAETLTAYVRDELAICDEIRPDLLIGDYRLSLCISGPVARVPFASIFNAHWSPYTRQPAIVPEHPLTHWISPRILSGIFAGLRPIFYALHAKPVNDVRKQFGLPALSHDLRRIYTAGDLTLYPDIPEFVRLEGPPPHHHFIGTCLWSAPTTKPAWWDEVMSSSATRILVSLGSTGALRALPAILNALSSLNAQVILITSGRSVGETPVNVHVADLLPFEEAARECALVISQGGIAGNYAALSVGTPMLAIPSNIDMHLSAALLEQSGAGLSVRVEDVSATTIRRAVDVMLSEPRFKQAAQHWGATIAKYDTNRLFPELLRQWFAARKGTAQ